MHLGAPAEKPVGMMEEVVTRHAEFFFDCGLQTNGPTSYLTAFIGRAGFGTPATSYCCDEQTFMDHFLRVVFSLSEILPSSTSATMQDCMPPALLTLGQ